VFCVSTRLPSVSLSFNSFTQPSIHEPFFFVSNSFFVSLHHHIADQGMRVLEARARELPAAPRPRR